MLGQPKVRIEYRIDGDDNPLLPSPQVNDNSLLPFDIINGSITDNLVDGVQDNDNSLLPSSQVNESVTNNLTSSPESSEHGNPPNSSPMPGGSNKRSCLLPTQKCDHDHLCVICNYGERSHPHQTNLLKPCRQVTS